MSTDLRGKRAPSLERLLRERGKADLAEFHSFWDGQGSAPKTTDEIVTSLVERMTDEDSVRKRLKFLSKKLVDLLKFLLRDRAYTANREQVLSSRLFDYMSQYEVEAALNALQKRGFVFQLGERGADGAGEIAFAIPHEIGEVLQTFLWDEECPLRDIFQLGTYLRRLSGVELEAARAAAGLPPHDGAVNNGKLNAEFDALVAALTSQVSLEARIRQLEPDLQEALRIAVVEGGSFVSKTLYDRMRGSAPRWDRRRFKRSLEGSFLGTIRHLALGEFGINHFDDTLIVFEEVATIARRILGGPSPADVTDVRTCGVDLVSDISNFLSYVAHTKIRLTLGGQIYRTVTKKVADEFILARKAEFAGFDSFQYIYDFAIAQRLVQKRDDRSLHITVKGRLWENEPLEKKLKVLLDFAFKDPLKDGESFHAPRLRERLLELLVELDVGALHDVFELPFRARNSYLASLEEEHVRDAFQNRYQYAPTAVMRDAAGLAQSLAQWLRERAYLLGLIDIGFRGEAITSLRVTPLGKRALGGTPQPETSAANERPLIVNPDFEILLFLHEGDTYDLITRIDRFADRVSSDSVYRYRVTEASIEKAVAEGLDIAEILRVLSENARGAIPQNVVYSIKEWAGKVRFVAARKVTVLRGRNREIMDRVLKGLSQQRIVCERLSPTAIMLESDVDLNALCADLARDGVFLEGTGVSTNGHGKGHADPAPISGLDVDPRPLGGGHEL
jgi:Helicase conserved C-terminal domain